VSVFSAVVTEKDRELQVNLDGRIDEDVQFPKINGASYEVIRIDLENIRGINSVGIREWIRWITPLSAATSVVLEHCPKTFVFNFTMIEGFLPTNAKVASFYVPFYSEERDAEITKLFHLGKEISVQNGKVVIDPNAMTTDLPTDAEMDTAEEKYFRFLLQS
jgi:hypothetical protein